MKLVFAGTFDTFDIVLWTLDEDAVEGLVPPLLPRFIFFDFAI
jgi:hypothetical protein